MSDQLPSSIQEVEGLILELYQPGSPARIAKVQEMLTRVQLSPEGWQVANSLLENPSEKIKFFGALTFTVKLNTDSQSLSEDDAHAVLQRIIGWLIKSINGGEGALVVRKLCSTLVSFFLRFSSTWNQCIPHLVYCLSANEAVSYDVFVQSAEKKSLIQNLPSEKALAVLWFATVLVEEVGKTDSQSMKQHQFHTRLISNVEYIVALMSAGIVDNPQVPVSITMRQESMKCFQAWVLYSHRAFVDTTILLDPLRTLTKPAINCLANDDLYEIAIELLTDVLTNFSRFLLEEDFDFLYALLSSSWAEERYVRLVKGDFDFDSLQFGQFMLAFGDAVVSDLAKKAQSDARSRKILSALCGLLSAEGDAVNEDKIFVPALEFWSTFVETLLDTFCDEGNERPPWVDTAQTFTMQAIEKSWRKIQYPTAEEFNSWDSVDRIGFKDARRDVGDLLTQSYLIVGKPLFLLFTELALASLAKGNAWAEVEASLYCLSVYSECLNGEECDEYLSMIFGSPLFQVLSAPDQAVPARVRQTFLTLVDNYSAYFERHTHYVPSALNLMFGMLDSPNLAKTASKSISTMCSSCRKLLVPELGAFLEQYARIAQQPSVDGYVKEGVTGAIASIIQAVPGEEAKLAPILKLLSFLQMDCERSLQLLSSQTLGMVDSTTNLEDTQAAAAEIFIIALRCLTSIAKGLRVPDDQPVDLDAEAVDSPYWTHGNGMLVQSQILEIVTKSCEVFRSNGEVIEGACTVLRSGLTELEPGPFVFTPNAIANFLLKADFNTPRLGVVINTACSLVSSHTAASLRSIDEITGALLTWISALLDILGDPSNDTEIAQASIDLLTRLVPKHLGALLSYQPPNSLENLFMFTLKALAGKDTLPKYSATEFWALFVKASSQDSAVSVDQVMEHLGPLLAQALIYNLGGNAARSELDKLSEPLKKLVVSQVRGKKWLEAALLGDGFPSQTVTEKDKILFLHKVMNLRGAKTTNQVVREFWLACRGSNFAYAS